MFPLAATCQIRHHINLPTNFTFPLFVAVFVVHVFLSTAAEEMNFTAYLP
jgi:hypothetical protein